MSEEKNEALDFALGKEVADKKLLQTAFGSLGDKFRGEIWENAARFKLVGKAYESLPPNQNGYFKIESIRHLEGPLRALLDPNVRIVFIIGATQVGKSVAGDIWIPYIMEHCPRNILVLFETDAKAKTFADARLMQTIKNHPVLKNILAQVSRHDATKTIINLPSMFMEICGLNDSNTSTLSWPIIWISEAWQSLSNGLLKKAMKRADKFPNDCKILIESQAGAEGEDLHLESKSAHQVHLSWACPLCGGRQTWECANEFGTQRPDDFVTNGKARAGEYAGMKFAAEIAEGREPFSIDERARTAEWECYHCGERIKDTRANRQAIMDSYQQDYKILAENGERISPSAVCFVIPREAACGNTFEDSVKSYLTAKDAQNFGNLLPIQNWYQSERAIFYSPKMTLTAVPIITGSYDVTGAIPNERARLFYVDCQMNPETKTIGHFWYESWAVDKFANIFQLARGYAESWEEWIAVQRKLKIPNKNVGLDGGNWLYEILDMAASKWEISEEQIGRKRIKIRSTWKVFIGNGKLKSFRWDDKQWRAVSQPSYYPRQIQLPDKSFATLQIPVYNWSNLSIKDQMATLRAGGEGKPKITVLPFSALSKTTQQKEVGDLAYAKQISVEYRTRKSGKDIWLEAKPSCNHYGDTGCGLLSMASLGGLIGHIVAPDESVQAVREEK